MAFFELLASICKCFPVEKVENVRFQIDYLCGRWSEGEDATHNKKTFFCYAAKHVCFGSDFNDFTSLDVWGKRATVSLTH